MNSKKNISNFNKSFLGQNETDPFSTYEVVSTTLCWYSSFVWTSRGVADY